MNKALLRRVAADIEARPRTYDQKTFCGTACCVAGHIALEAGAKRNKGVWGSYMSFPASYTGVQSISAFARYVAGLSVEQASNLFFAAPRYVWPQPFARQFVEARNATERAKVAAARIRHMIRTGE